MHFENRYCRIQGRLFSISLLSPLHVPRLYLLHLLTAFSVGWPKLLRRLLRRPRCFLFSDLFFVSFTSTVVFGLDCSLVESIALLFLVIFLCAMKKNLLPVCLPNIVHR